HLFVSIQSFNSQVLWERVAPDFYDFVVLDEFHHAAAPSYQRLLEFIQPQPVGAAHRQLPPGNRATTYTPRFCEILRARFRRHLPAR
ncbi:MAG: DEAD/DEAH box helicase family protein, partial [Deltaproteobacteria bacterium]|nr:DEAD/DEAH box helicase family protein [Deltaproteobacteria bacterium]